MCFKVVTFPLPRARCIRGFFSVTHCDTNLVELLEENFTKLWGSQWQGSPGLLNSQRCPQSPPAILHCSLGFPTWHRVLQQFAPETPCFSKPWVLVFPLPILQGEREMAGAWPESSSLFHIQEDLLFFKLVQLLLVVWVQLQLLSSLYVDPETH